jgi:hypothetical protein
VRWLGRRQEKKEKKGGSRAVLEERGKRDREGKLEGIFRTSSFLFSNFCFLKKNHTTANKTNAKA